MLKFWISPIINSGDVLHMIMNGFLIWLKWSEEERFLQISFSCYHCNSHRNCGPFGAFTTLKNSNSETCLVLLFVKKKITQ